MLRHNDEKPWHRARLKTVKPSLSPDMAPTHMFHTINHLTELLPHVADKKEIRFLEHRVGAVVGCYLFCDGNTFDSTYALECRGIAFDRHGVVVSSAAQVL
jgi:hypothetical protein